MQFNFLISLIISGLLLLSNLGCDNSFADEPKKDSTPTEEVEVTDPEDQQEVKYMTGVVIDGLISNSQVQIGDKTVYSDENGEFKIEFSENSTITALSGTDNSTGENLEALFSHQTGTDSTEFLVLSPTSSIISKLIENGDSRDEAFEKVASFLDVSIDSLKINPMNRINSEDETEKTNAQAILKSNISLQKTAEVIAKTISSSDENYSNYQEVIKSVALTINSEVSTTETKKVVKASSSSLNQILSDSEKITGNLNVSDDVKANIKKLASAIETITSSTEKIDFSSDESFNKSAKALEVVSSVFKSKITENKIDEVENIAKAVAVLGGIEKIAENTDSNVKASSFGDSLFSDEMVNNSVKFYDDLSSLNLSADEITNIAKKVSSS